jgi:hypothetical protein
MFPVTIIHAKAQQLGLLYLVIGGHAVNAYCEPRTTLDVDLLVRKEDGPRWRELLTAEGFRLRNECENFVQFSPPYGVSFRVDLMLVNDSTFAKLHSTARRIMCLGTEALIPTALNLIALKIHAIRHGPAERKNKDWLDIENLVRAMAINLRDPELIEVFHRQGALELYAELLKRCVHDESQVDELKDAAAPFGLDLPAAPAWFSEPPTGSLDDGIRLSLLALEQLQDRPEVFVQREQRRCEVEFKA